MLFQSTSVKVEITLL